MRNNRKCPTCNSNNINVVNYMGIKCIVYKNCEYDESKQYEVFQRERNRRRQKEHIHHIRQGVLKEYGNNGR